MGLEGNNKTNRQVLIEVEVAIVGFVALVSDPMQSGEERREFVEELQTADIGLADVSSIFFPAWLELCAF